MSFSSPASIRLVFCAVLLVALSPDAASAQGTLLPQEISSTPFSQWQVKIGDALIVDTRDNVGYLVHQEGGYVSFPVVTGQRRTVRYIGRTYDAATPNRSWTALSKETKDDRITFGKLGTFFRLFRDGGTEETPYGIHAHAYGEEMLSRQERHRSMGCIIVSESVLGAIEITYALNGDRLPVRTVYGLSSDVVTYPLLLEVMATQTKNELWRP